VRLRRDTVLTIVFCVAACAIWAGLLNEPLPLLFVSIFTGKIAADNQNQQIWDWVLGGRVTDWLLVTVGILQFRVYRQQAAILRRQSETLPRLERAYLYVRVTEPGINIVENGIRCETIKFSIENLGNTPAQLTRIAFIVDTAKHGTIIKPIDPTAVGGRELTTGTVVARGMPHAESENLRAKLGFFTPKSIKILSGHQTAWLTGFVRYIDVFDQHRIEGFTLVFDTTFNVWVRRGDNRLYNYSRTENAKDIPKPGEPPDAAPDQETSPVA